MSFVYQEGPSGRKKRRNVAQALRVKRSGVISKHDGEDLYSRDYYGADFEMSSVEAHTWAGPLVKVWRATPACSMYKALPKVISVVETGGEAYAFFGELPRVKGGKIPEDLLSAHASNLVAHLTSRDEKPLHLLVKPPLLNQSDEELSLLLALFIEPVWFSPHLGAGNPGVGALKDLNDIDLLFGQ